MAIKKNQAGACMSLLRTRAWSFSLSFSLLLLLSCAPQKKAVPPPDLIGRAGMIALITDLTLSEAVLGGEPLASFNDTLKKINVFKEHNVTSERFLSSFKYYTENPGELKSIYDEVLTSLEQRPLPDTVPR